jgi:(p)ppGpp synthase/HD superfamily hydrolase
MSTLQKAIEIAIEAHRGQTDKSGAPYILHPLRVMQRGNTDIEKICGVLHDLIEDTSWTFEQLATEGFSEGVIEVLRCVTKLSEEEDYEDFIGRIKQNPIAIKVKLNDLQDNMDITRFNELTEKDRVRLNKYLKAFSLLRKC